MVASPFLEAMDDPRQERLSVEKMVLVTVALLMAAMFAFTAVPALAAALRPPIAGIMGGGGTPVDAAVCEVVADENDSGLFEWRPGGVCWFTPPAQ